MNRSIKRELVFGVGCVETAVWAAFIYYLMVLWYPNEHFALFEIGLGFSALLGLLFLLGPLFGVFLYKSDQTAYVNDLTVIYLLRILVIIVAIHYAYTHRPILTVFSVDRLVVVQAHQIPPDHIPIGIAKLMLADDNVPLVAARQLDDGNLAQLLEVMGGAPDIEYRPSRYEQFEYQRESFIRRFCYNPTSDQITSKKANGDCVRVALPLVYKVDQLATAIVDVPRGEILELTSQLPWQ